MYLSNSKNAFKFIYKSNKDDIYDNLLYVKDNLRRDTFLGVINALLDSSNSDLMSKEAAFRYIYEYDEKGFLEQLIQIRMESKTKSSDSTWETKISKNSYRVNFFDNHFYSNLNSAIHKLETGEDFDYSDCR